MLRILVDAHARPVTHCPADAAIARKSIGHRSVVRRDAQIVTILQAERTASLASQSSQALSTIALQHRLDIGRRGG